MASSLLVKMRFIQTAICRLNEREDGGLVGCYELFMERAMCHRVQDDNGEVLDCENRDVKQSE